MSIAGGVSADITQSHDGGRHTRSDPPLLVCSLNCEVNHDGQRQGDRERERSRVLRIRGFRMGRRKGVFRSMMSL